MQYQEAGAGGAELCRVEGGSGMSMISAGQAEGLHITRQILVQNFIWYGVWWLRYGMV